MLSVVMEFAYRNATNGKDDGGEKAALWTGISLQILLLVVLDNGTKQEQFFCEMNNRPDRSNIREKVHISFVGSESMDPDDDSLPSRPKLTSRINHKID
jgi:hypothetical protein